MVAVKGDSGKEILNTAAQDSVSGFVDDDLSQSEESDSDYELPESASTPNLKEAVDVLSGLLVCLRFKIYPLVRTVKFVVRSKRNFGGHKMMRQRFPQTGNA